MSNRRFHSASDHDEPMDDSSDISYPDLTQHQQTQHQRSSGPHRPAAVIKRSKMNELIMDYLVHEGFREAAERFREEAGVEMNTPEGKIDTRAKIRKLIEEGDILEGQSLINSHFPELLDNNREKHFRLQQQHMIELIRKQKIEEVLAFVHDQLKIDEIKDLTEMERTLALLAYEDPENSPYSNLLERAHRLRLASELNDLMLLEASGDIELKKPKIVTLMKLLHWSQSELDKKKIPYDMVPETMKPVRDVP